MANMARSSRLNNPTFRTIFVVILIAAPFLLAFLPGDYFDKGESICISKLLTDEDCPGCGMTRAIQHSLHLEFDVAYSYNKLVVIVLPLLIVVWAKEIYRSVQIIRRKSSDSRND